MKKAVFFAIVIVLVSFLSSCAIRKDECPGVGQINTPEENS
tara:strand:- start:1396 stop:1518 length:123 start_codon:yes stop_codon:yes gene_type:complete